MSKENKIHFNTSDNSEFNLRYQFDEGLKIDKENTESINLGETFEGNMNLEDELSKQESLEEEDYEEKDSIEIFTVNIEDGYDYSHLYEDEGFNTWLNKTHKFLIENENSNYIYFQIKDLRYWYKEYKETLPYIEKLNTIFKDIEVNSKNELFVKLSKSKIDLLIYELRGLDGIKDEQKQKIDDIFESYEKSKILKEELDSYCKREELREVFERNKYRKNLEESLKLNETVKNILESQGEEYVKENISELLILLKDFKSNYDFYSSGTEKDSPDSIDKIYKRYTFNNSLVKDGIIKESLKLDKWYKKATNKFGSFFVKENDDINDYNNITSLIISIRKLNLVCTQNSENKKNQENKNRMIDLINFIEDNFDILIKKINSSKSDEDIINEIKKEKGENLDERDLEMLKIMLDLYKESTKTKHKTNQSFLKAGEIISKNEIPEENEYSEKDAIDFIYESEEEKELFESKAKIIIYRERLSLIQKDIRKHKKNKEGKKNKDEYIKNIHKLKGDLDSLSEGINKLGNDEDKELLKVIELQLNHLILENIDNMSELKKFIDIDCRKILSSIEKYNKKQKIDFIEDLIKRLKDFDNDNNNIPRKTILNKYIQKFREILNKLNKN